MAGSDAVWGIDIGQCALKALRCRPHEDEDKIIADAFDFIEYPKNLTQADADPDELIGDALQQFLDRNSLKGDRVAVSVSGQSGLARFIKLPPVEKKKIPDIVRFEARQQIPFDLNDVIWDYQRMGGGVEEEGFALETEIGLFAMKREAVFRALTPYQKAGIEVDFIQLAPLAIYNWVLFDQMPGLPPAEEYDSENPPDSVVVFSIGTDATDLVVTNGFTVWQRSVPLGGNHFTKALTKELKLTSAKAEHLKRNATAAQDPKAIFQAMRPVFNDLLTELQRSIGYFTNIDRNATIGRVLSLGNAMKLSGLQTYLTKSLGHNCERVDEYRGLVGPQVTSSPAFQENALSFAVCYGLCLQGLGRSGLRTNLLPGEIVQDRLIRQKKPWAVAAAAILLLACTVGFAASSLMLSTVREDDWSGSKSSAKSEVTSAAKFVSDHADAQKKFVGVRDIGNQLVANIDNRVRWAELVEAINSCLPKDVGKRPETIYKRNELQVVSIDRQQTDLAAWYASARQRGEVARGAEEMAGAASAPAGGEEPQEGEGDGQEKPAAGPVGKGWVIQITGYHYHNPPQRDHAMPPGFVYGPAYLQETLMKNLLHSQVRLYDPDRQPEVVSMQELGVSYPVLIDPRPVNFIRIEDPDAEDPDAGAGGLGIPLGRFDFQVQFCWQPKSPTQRRDAREAAANAQQDGQSQE